MKNATTTNTSETDIRDLNTRITRANVEAHLRRVLRVEDLGDVPFIDILDTLRDAFEDRKVARKIRQSPLGVCNSMTDLEYELIDEQADAWATKVA